MSIHTERLNAEFKKALSETIRDCIRDPRLSEMLSITNVEITRDLKYAKVFVSVFDTDESRRQGSVDVLNAAKGVIAREMNGRIRMRRIPSMTFVLDGSIEYSVHIAKVLNDIGAGAQQEAEEDE